MGNVVTPIVVITVIVASAIWGIGLIAFSDDEIRVKEPLVYKTELVIENNQVDTVYVYQIP